MNYRLNIGLVRSIHRLVGPSLSESGRVVQVVIFLLEQEALTSLGSTGLHLGHLVELVQVDFALWRWLLHVVLHLLGRLLVQLLLEVVQRLLQLPVFGVRVLLLLRVSLTLVLRLLRYHRWLRVLGRLRPHRVAVLLLLMILPIVKRVWAVLRKHIFLVTGSGFVRLLRVFLIVQLGGSHTASHLLLRSPGLVILRLHMVIYLLSLGLYISRTI